MMTFHGFGPANATHGQAAPWTTTVLCPATAQPSELLFTVPALGFRQLAILGRPVPAIC
jgi:hypothetical protein